MHKAARAIIIEGDQILVMLRVKQGDQYFTLVGGRIDENETTEAGLVREIKEETGLSITKSHLVFIEEHPEPYNQQYIYVCEVAPHSDVAIQAGSEEDFLNKIDIDTHEPMWVNISSFSQLAFRTPQLQQAIIAGIDNGFPVSPIKL